MRCRTGAEIELLAPVGSSRYDVAQTIAQRINGRVQRSWHIDSEPAAHAKIKLFHHLTPAFDVLDQTGQLYARLVDDITIRRDLDSQKPSIDGWSRVVSDDARILRMLEGVLSPQGGDLENVAQLLEPLGLTCIEHRSTIKVTDSSGASVALIAGLPGERQRVCEIISPPLADGLVDWLKLVVSSAADLGFTVPYEAATHFHYDSEPFRDVDAFQRLVWNFTTYREAIRRSFRTNQNCSRLGPLPEGLLALVDSPEYERMSWEDAARSVRKVEGISKYCDVNILGLTARRPLIDTVEFRMLPSSTSSDELLELLNLLDSVVQQIIGEQDRNIGTGLAS